jgi:hypothetical protein
MFGGLSNIHDLENALGQYRLYRFVIARQEPERTCYLAITTAAYDEFGNSTRSFMRRRGTLHKPQWHVEIYS